jgi:opacity protein-like surface antigen
MLGRVSIAVAGLTLSAFAYAESDREAGWEGGIDIVYQAATTINFNGGSKASLDDDLGFSITFGYRISPRLETQFALDWSSVDYGVTLVTGTGGTLRGSGSYEAFTPRFNLVLNILNQPFTPFAMAGVGYAFIDTNIPNGRPSTGCWWDPWYGYLCTTVTPTKSIDGLTYQAGFGLRWDVTESGTLRLGYERHWVDFGHSGEPYVDQVKLGFVWRY